MSAWQAMMFPPPGASEEHEPIESGYGRCRCRHRRRPEASVARTFRLRPTSIKGAAAGFVGLPHQVLILDRELKRVSARLPSSFFPSFSDMAADQSERA